VAATIAGNSSCNGAVWPFGQLLQTAALVAPGLLSRSRVRSGPDVESEMGFRLFFSRVGPTQNAILVLGHAPCEEHCSRRRATLKQ